jgi:hypothetical protein
MSRVIQMMKKSGQWAWGHKIRTIVLLVVFVVTAPQPVKSQFLDPCCGILSVGLTTIGNTLSSVIGGGLKNILSIEQDLKSFQESVVWPQKLIDQARSLVGSVQGTFAQIREITQIRVNSATLPATQQFEQTLLSRDPTQVSQASSQYTSVYGPVPDATAASFQTRNMIDMTDAAAQAAMKRAIAIDALADLELQAAGQINQSIQSAAPGSAPIIEAQADAWLVRANAYTQAATADLIRVRAIDLANEGASVKNGAANAATIEQQILNLLKRQ